MSQSEDIIQSEFFEWAWNTHPALRRRFFHVPNGGKRSKTEAARFKSLGVVAGVADFILINNGHVLMIEFKDATGKQSPAQKEFEQTCRDNQTPYFVCRTAEEAKRVFEEFYQVKK